MNYHYYNENDPYAAQWLRNLMAAQLIPEGCVDTRSILDVQPEDLAVFTQCHFFAGIGGWPLALRLAGWPVDKHVWTGSCPCQPFSVAGKRKGNSDERHLWPYFHKLISECSPPTVFGEQVASKDGREWLSGVRTDLEAVGYAVGAADLCAASAGAPHIRQRLFWVADSVSERSHTAESVAGTPERLHGSAITAYGIKGLADTEDFRRQRRGEAWGGGTGSENDGAVDGLGNPASEGSLPGAQPGVYCSEEGRGARHGEPERSGDANGMEHATGDGREQRRSEPVGRGLEPRRSTSGLGDTHDAGPQRRGLRPEQSPSERAAGTPGSAFWDAFDLVPCADGKARRIESGTFPLAHGVPGRVGKLRAYGNAISPQVAAGFIEAFLEAAP